MRKGAALTLAFVLCWSCGDDFESNSGSAGSAGVSSGGKGGAQGKGGGTSAGGNAQAGAITKGGEGGSATQGEAGSTAEAGSGPCVLGTNWTTIDEFQLSPGELSSPEGIATAPPNTLFTVGVARMITFRWHVRRSLDGGQTWDDVDMLDAGGAGDVVVDQSGNVFVVGTLNQDRIVRRSVDGGDEWTTVDTFPLAADSPCSSGALAVDSNGIVYVSGTCDVEGVTVRRSVDGGDNWETVETFLLEAPTRMPAIGVDANDQVYVGGNANEAGFTRWLVRRGTDLGSWSTADNYQLSDVFEARNTGFGGRDAIYAVGSALDDDGLRHWIVRRAALDDAAGFTTVDDVAPEAGTEREAQSIYQDRLGRLIVAGRITDQNVSSVVAYRHSDDGVTWQDGEEFAYVQGLNSQPVGRLVADSQGNLYGMVNGAGTDGAGHWIVRKLPCEPEAP